MNHRGSGDSAARLEAAGWYHHRRTRPARALGEGQRAGPAGSRKSTPIAPCGGPAQADDQGADQRPLDRSHAAGGNHRKRQHNDFDADAERHRDFWRHDRAADRARATNSERRMLTALAILTDGLAPATDRLGRIGVR